MYKRSAYRDVHKHIKNNIHKHVGKHVLKHAHKITYHINHTHHTLIHMGELVLVGTIGFMSLMFAGSSNLPNNTSFSYPLQKVSTVECRTLYRNDMPDSCKINLPIIHGANYDAYKNDSTYRSIYTTLRAAPYSDSWNQKLGAHAGVDMATARGTPLYSVGDGEVWFAGRNSAYGNVVKIKYVYNGEIVYAVYAHMDKINVQKGDKVSRGQRIGDVGNSGNTFGKLGGYHVHFEIDKDNYGRPAYSYTNCPDLKKGHYKIIQNGLCRIELFRYQYDPIKIFESDSKYISDNDENSENSEDEKNTGDTEDNNIIIDETEVVSASTGLDDTDIIDINDENKDGDIDKRQEVVDNNHNSAIDDDKLNEEVEEIKSENEENIVEPTTDVEDIIDIKNDVDGNTEDIDNNDDISTDIVVDKTNEDEENKIVIDEDDKTLLELNFDGVSLLAQHFLSLWDIEMHSDLLEKDLSVGETIVIDIDIFKRGIDDATETREYNKKYNGFKGVMKLPFMIISSNKNIDIDINYLQLITKGKAQIKITGKKIGDSGLIINFGGKKVGMLNIKIK